MALKQTAQALAKKFGGTRPVTDDDGATYTFTFSQDDVSYIAVVGEMDDDRHVLIFIGGDSDNRRVKDILDSVEDK